MLLLSSATRILATKRPPDVLHPFFARQTCRARNCSAMTEKATAPRLPIIKTPQYWSIRRIGRQSQRGTGVSEMDMASLTPFRCLHRAKKQRVRPEPHPSSHPRYLPEQTTRGPDCVVPSSSCCSIPFWDRCYSASRWISLRLSHHSLLPCRSQPQVLRLRPPPLEVSSLLHRWPRGQPLPALRRHPSVAQALRGRSPCLRLSHPRSLTQSHSQIRWIPPSRLSPALSWQ